MTHCDWGPGGGETFKVRNFSSLYLAKFGATRGHGKVLLHIMRIKMSVSLKKNTSWQKKPGRVGVEVLARAMQRLGNH